MEDPKKKKKSKREKSSAFAEVSVVPQTISRHLPSVPYPGEFLSSNDTSYLKTTTIITSSPSPSSSSSSPPSISLSSPPSSSNFYQVDPLNPEK